MAEEQDNMPQGNSTSSVEASAFVSGMIKDVDDTYIPEGSWSHARNATKVTANGSLNTLSNEPGNSICITNTVTNQQFTDYTIIGAIHVVEDKWVIFSTNNTNSEIGLYDDSECSYTTMAKEPCVIPPCNVQTQQQFQQLIGNQGPLNFNTKNLITGASKANFDCTYSTYFSDGLNPDRFISFDVETRRIVDNQFVVCRTINNSGCSTDVPTCKLNLDAIRMASLVKSPCINVSGSGNSGSLLNGSYFVVIAYTINQQKVTDYFPPSNVQGLFNHQNVAGSIDISFSNLDTDRFDEFELVVVRTFNLQTSAKKLGIYSTRTTSLTVDNINEALPSVPIEQIPIRTPVIEKSDAIYNIGSYLVRSGPTSRFDFNYQPLANRIAVKWQAVEYDTDYYRKGGNNTGYMRDEVYSFFIRWIYDTGDRSSSFHIPGRAPEFYYIGVGGIPRPESAPSPGAPGIVFTQAPGTIQPFGEERIFEVFNTAVLTGSPGTFLPDGGVLRAEGIMGFWESTERYPDNKPEVWNLSYYDPATNPLYTGTLWPGADVTIPDANNNRLYDLCGQYIRHHKMPDNLLGVINTPNAPNPTETRAQILNDTNDKIRVLGVKFENIALPRDNDGNFIPGIAGYEILRGSREGNKTVIAKGIINSMRSYPNPFGGNDILYQNYPYNYRDTDPTLVVGPSRGGWSLLNQPLNLDSSYVRPDKFTFHSPETQFRKPFLAVNELKLYGETIGNITGSFSEVDGHPKEKLLTDFAFIIAALVGVVEAIIALQGKRKYNHPRYYENLRPSTGQILQQSLGWTPISGSIPSVWPSPSIPPLDATPAAIPQQVTAISIAAGYNTLANAIYGNSIVGGITSWYGTPNLTTSIINGAYGGASAGPTATAWGILAARARTVSNVAGVPLLTANMEGELGYADYLPTAIRAVAGISLFSQYWVQGTDTALRLIYALVPYEQYAASYTSHALYGQPLGTAYPNQRRRYRLDNAVYLASARQTFGDNDINNLYRSSCVALSIDPTYAPTGVFAPSLTTDNSVQTIGTASQLPNSSVDYNNITPEFNTSTSSHYAGLIQRIKNQYGQLDSIQQINISCPYPIVSSLGDSQATGTVFGGDIYINRYTEKNTFFYFYDWLQDQPDGYEYNYRNYYMVGYPRYWADFQRFEVGEFLQGFFGQIFNPAGQWTVAPNDKAALDIDALTPFNFVNVVTTLFTPQFRIKNGYFYLFQSGVRDFYCESEVNTAFRDWGELPEQRFYDPDKYTNLTDLFAPSIIKFDNYYKYDYSLSISKLYFNFISWGNVQGRGYNPYVASTCYTYTPARLNYSLEDSAENTKDFWRVWLPNNYKDFYSEVSGIKAYNANGAIIVFKNDSPTLWKGVDELQTNIGTKITLGDGGLFEQAEQSLVNTDISLEYGSSQDYLSIINTPFGLYYISAEQGKIFHVTNRLDDITYAGLKFWFKEYLPYQLLQDFPTFDITANPVAGIGCQAIYDNQIEIIYFTKKDYKLRYGWNLDPTDPDFLGRLDYVGDGKFTVNTAAGAQFTIDVTVVGYPAAYFQDASWTVSYDPKSEKGGWISFHDWHPDLCLPSRKHFLTITNRRTSLSVNGQGTIWRHNLRRDDFCIFYGTYYPFELEYIASTKLSVNTLRSVEYYMECYKYKRGSLDRFHLLNWNFDKAVVYNTEQVSGDLTLNLAEPNDPFGNLGFPRLDILIPTWNILYNKVEQKYRFDQFWDITNDRGEFTNSEQEIWITDPNGYTRVLNINNLNYNKDQTQRKKFRHYTNKVVLTKSPPQFGLTNPINMTVKVALDKNLLSMR